MFLVIGGFGLTTVFDFTSNNATAEAWSKSIDVDTTWSSDKNLMKDIYISSGATLTINPGVTVLFNGNFNLIVNSTGKLVAKGSESQQITFNRVGNNWTSLKVLGLGMADLDWCSFINATDGIALENNVFRTNVTNCSFSYCNNYFNLTNSQVNVTSSKFNGSAFDNKTDQKLGKLKINDANSELFIEYFINIYTVNGSSDLTQRPRTTNPVAGVNVQIDDSTATIAGGITDSNGEFINTRARALKITGTGKTQDYLYNDYTMRVSDKWDGTGQAVLGISRNTTTMNISSVANHSTVEDAYEIDSNMHINVFFMFKYPPVISTAPNRVTVYEGVPKHEDFVFYDNDDTDFENNITFNITDQDGADIYGDNTEDKWVSWTNESESGGQLHFDRTIETRWAAVDDYDAVVEHTINVTVIDLLGQRVKKTITVEFHNVPDKPEIDNLESNVDVVEDQTKYISIDVSDDDNSTADINITSDSDYVTYVYNSSNDQALRFSFPNEFGEDESQQLVNISATDFCSEEVVYQFNVLFHQTPDEPSIIGTIPNKVGNETDWTPELVLSDHWSDPDPDDDVSTLKWYVTGVDDDYFEVPSQSVTANSPLSFNFIYEGDLGGARNPVQVKDNVTIWLEDQYGLTAQQEIDLILDSTNQQPSLHKLGSGSDFYSVDPEIGDSEQNYYFYIEYKDRDGLKGDAPEYVKVFIDDNEEGYDMIEDNPSDTDYSDGKIYYYFTTLTPGNH